MVLNNYAGQKGLVECQKYSIESIRKWISNNNLDIRARSKHELCQKIMNYFSRRRRSLSTGRLNLDHCESYKIAQLRAWVKRKNYDIRGVSKRDICQKLRKQMARDKKSQKNNKGHRQSTHTSSSSSRVKNYINCEQDGFDFIKRKKMGEGYYGAVHIACQAADNDDDVNCDYVAKIQLFKDSRATPFNISPGEWDDDIRWHRSIYRNEVDILKRLNRTKMKLVPKFLGSWECEREMRVSGGKYSVPVGVIIMEKYEGTLNELLKSRMATASNIKKWSDQLYEKIAKVNSLGVLHNDLTPWNVLYKRNAKLPGGIELVLTDFGLSLQRIKGTGGRLRQIGAMVHPRPMRKLIKNYDATYLQFALRESSVPRRRLEQFKFTKLPEKSATALKERYAESMQWIGYF